MDGLVIGRRELGSKGSRIFRDTGRPDQVRRLTRWGSFAKARAFIDREVPRGSSATPGALFLNPLEDPAA